MARFGVRVSTWEVLCNLSDFPNRAMKTDASVKTPTQSVKLVKIIESD